MRFWRRPEPGKLFGLTVLEFEHVEKEGFLFSDLGTMARAGI